MATAAVVGVPHAIHGEEIVAAIVLNPDSEVTEDESSRRSANASAYKCSRIVWITDGLPMCATGKILKREIQIPPA